MNGKYIPDRLDRALGRFFWGLAVIGGFAIIAMMLITVTDVFMRFVFDTPLASNIDITQMAMVVAVFCALAHCGWTGGHVVVDVVAGLMPGWLVKPLGVVMDLIAGALMFGIGWMSVHTARDFYDTGEVSFTIQFPLWPFLIVCAVGSFIYALALFVMAARPNRPREE